ncbi:hypothetical protein CHARACLAT_033332 [Characodon lateralis]|uniref:Uncharacterized protein n=1 Tax=Characodon lateralis TaxID=208331 RepID=A0ABU7EZ46_9TELE|nr:hypothetical protein [Characodon lateralis]
MYLTVVKCLETTCVVNWHYINKTELNQVQAPSDPGKKLHQYQEKSYIRTRYKKVSEPGTNLYQNHVQTLSEPRRNIRQNQVQTSTRTRYRSPSGPDPNSIRTSKKPL